MHPLLRRLALNRSLPFKRLRYYGIPSVTFWLSRFPSVRLSLPCSRCKRRKWAEEVVGNYGWCDDCFNETFDRYARSSHDS